METRQMTKMEIIKCLNDSMNSEFKEEREIASILFKHHNIDYNKLQQTGGILNENTYKYKNYIQC